MKIHVYENFFLKVVSEDSENYLGFNILTEEYLEVSKKDKFILISDSILALFNEKNRFMLASQLKKTVDKISELMEVSDRTIFRYRDLIKNAPIK
jgi:hypothetical protein